MTAAPYPPTRKHPVESVHSGRVIVDPYVWLEDDTPETLAWQRAQDEFTTEQLASWLHLESLRELVVSLYPRTDAAPRRAGVGLRPGGANGPLSVLVRTDADGAETVLLDLNVLAPDWPGRPTLDWTYPSPDGTHIAVGVSSDGDEDAFLWVIRLADAVVVARHPHCSKANVAWLPEARGLFVNAGRQHELVDLQRHLYFVDITTGAVTEVAELDFGGADWVAPQGGRDVTAIVVFEGNFLGRPWYVRENSDEAPWRPFLRDAAGTYDGIFLGMDYYAVATAGAPRGRLVRVALADDGSVTETLLLAESDLVLRAVLPLSGDRLLVVGVQDARSTALVVRLDGEVEATVPAPGPGRHLFAPLTPWLPRSCYLEPAASPPPAVTFVFEGPGWSPAIYRYDVATDSTSVVQDAAIRDPQVEVVRHHATASDGVLVPFDIARHEGSQGGPALVFAYGGFNSPWSLLYLPILEAITRSGGTVVIPYLRGGGEFGLDWWNAGRRARKAQTFDDLFAVAEMLVKEGIADPARIAVWGMSNGGMLAGAATVRRPDLWAAVVSEVPVLDLLRITRDPWGAFRTVPEYGDPDSADDVDGLLAISPYHTVPADKVLPPTLVYARGGDTRTLPWHSRKFVARLQEASGGPFLLRVEQGAGHIAGGVANDAVQRDVDRLAFLMQHLELAPPLRKS